MTTAGTSRAAFSAGVRRGLLATLAAAVVLALGIVIGAAIEDHSRAGAPGSAAAGGTPSAVDIGFSQDMIVHHEQAVVMAQLVRDRTKNPKIAALAAGIEGDQLLDIGALRGYLALWEAPVLPAGPPMTWMAGHGAHTEDGMPGLATVAELNALRAAKGTALDRMFLELMARHHAGGLAMLDDAAANAAVPAVRGLAARISFHQKEETQTINALLAQQR